MALPKTIQIPVPPIGLRNHQVPCHHVKPPSGHTPPCQHLPQRACQLSAGKKGNLFCQHCRRCNKLQPLSASSHRCKNVRQRYRYSSVRKGTTHPRLPFSLLVLDSRQCDGQNGQVLPVSDYMPSSTHIHTSTYVWIG